MEIKAYLAGPDIVRENAREYCNWQKEKCLEYGIIPIHPMDNKQDGTPLEIYKQDIESIDNCDIIIANFQSYRGSLIDDGTAFECGYGIATGKKVYGYLEDGRLYSDKMSIVPGFVIKKSNQRVNLMLEQSATKLVIGSFVDCLEEIEKDFNLSDKARCKRK